MLAIITYRGGTSSLRKRQLRELLRSVDELSAMPALSIAEHGVEGDRGCLSIVDRGFILHAYFSGRAVRFEVYGPFAPGTEQSPRPPWEYPGLTGSMSTACLKEVLRILDRGRSPLEHIRMNASESRPVEFDA